MPAALVRRMRSKGDSLPSGGVGLSVLLIQIPFPLCLAYICQKVSPMTIAPMRNDNCHRVNSTYIDAILLSDIVTSCRKINCVNRPSPKIGATLISHLAQKSNLAISTQSPALYALKNISQLLKNRPLFRCP
jgi:hypothetical protein